MELGLLGLILVGQALSTRLRIWSKEAIMGWIAICCGLWTTPMVVGVPIFILGWAWLLRARATGDPLDSSRLVLPVDISPHS